MSAARVLPFLYGARQLRGSHQWKGHNYQNSTRQQDDAGDGAPELAFYRKYTEALLRRYLQMSLQLGRVPSMLGQEMFRGRVTAYQARSFEDMVIFVHDVERCIGRLDRCSQNLIARITLQEYTQDETATLLGQNKKAVVKGYGQAIDRLTRLLLDVEILRPRR